MTIPPIPPFQAGEQIGATKLNQLRAAAFMPVVGSGGITVRQSGQSTIISGHSLWHYFFKLTSALERSSVSGVDDDVLSATAVRRRFDPATNAYYDGSGETRLYFPCLPLWNSHAVASGDIVQAFPNQASGRWESFATGPDVFRATANFDIASGASNKVTLRYDNGDPITDPANGDADVEVAAFNLTGRDLPAGAEIVVAKSGVGSWLIIESTWLHIKPYCLFTLDGDLETSDATASATIVQEYGHGRHQPASSIFVHNLPKSGGGYVFEGNAGTYGYAFHASDEDYLILILPCRPPAE